MTRHGIADGATVRDLEPEPPRPSRPAAMELGAAILIVGGVLSIIGALATAGDLPAGTELFLALSIGLGIGSIAVGLLARLGRFWILAVNYVAVLGFLDLTGAGVSQLALLLGVADMIVLLILLLHRPWFDAVRAWRAARIERRRSSP